MHSNRRKLGTAGGHIVLPRAQAECLGGSVSTSKGLERPSSVFIGTLHVHWYVILSESLDLALSETSYTLGLSCSYPLFCSSQFDIDS